MYDVTALGEALIDFIPAGKSENGNILIERNPGGAPANVLAALAKLGKRTAFIGKVGDDQFGKFLKTTLQDIQVDTKGIVFSQNTNTTLAFVHLNDQGERSFTFYRNPGADMTLKEEEIDFNIIENSRIFHFGSVSLTHETSASATLSAVSYAKKKDSIISYDPNLRVHLWKDLNHARQMVLHGLRYADILKISEEELEFISGTSDLIKGSKYIYDQFQIILIFITLGGKGCFYRRHMDTGLKVGYRVTAIDTTGAGDAFLAGILYQIIEMNRGLSQLSMNDLEQMVAFANAIGALVTTKKGAISAMPSLKEIFELASR